MSVTSVLNSRVSANSFDASASLSEEQIQNLVALASQAPSSFNIQHTRFVAVTDPDLKTSLMGAAYGQPKVRNAAVAFVVLGDLRAHEDFITRTRAAAAAGFLPADIAERMCGMAGGMYSNPAMARDEALRSVGLSGMALMLAAEEQGFASCPMIGFDPSQFSKILNLADRYVPMMLIVVGPGAAGNGPRRPRLSVAELLRVNSGDFPA